MALLPYLLFILPLLCSVVISEVTTLACIKGTCLVKAKPGTRIEAELYIPFKLKTIDPVFSPRDCDHNVSICTRLDSQVVDIMGTIRDYSVTKLEFDCFPKGFSTLEIIRVGQMIPTPTARSMALSKHYIELNQTGHIVKSPKIVVSCDFSGALLPRLKDGQVRSALIMPMPQSEICPKGAFCFKKSERITFNGTMGVTNSAFTVFGMFPEERITVVFEIEQ